LAERILNLFASYAWTDAYWLLPREDRRSFRLRIAGEAQRLGKASHLYNVFPCRADTDFLLWSAQIADEEEAAALFVRQYAHETEEWRRYVRPVQTLWGFTRPSTYSRGKSEQDIDPFEEERCRYLVIYPFSKTKDWYLMSMDSRQGMMNEHIKLGKQYFDIKQLLLYSFGLQDQEFVVSYEMQDLVRFSELVNALRSTEARRYTLLDTPLITGVFQGLEEWVGEE
jgi:chlorite dismutase